jgi:hypothetical protein
LAGWRDVIEDVDGETSVGGLSGPHFRQRVLFFCLCMHVKETTPELLLIAS